MSTDNEVRLKRALLAIQNLRGELESARQASREPIAVIGLGCRFPGADGPAAFWQLLQDGRDAIQEVPSSRWNVDAYYDPRPEANGKMYTRHGGFIERPAAFDAAFFGISSQEADSLDPQQRLILEVAWESLEHAGLNPERLTDSATGVFIGMGTSDYLQMLQQNAPERTDLYMLTGNAHCVASGRLSYLLGLRGPSLVVDTACSSSLVATHLAVMSLRNGECDLALAGGVTLMLTPQAYIAQCRAKMLSADGRCHTFDASANGYVRGEGCGMVVLKRLSLAKADGDRILAVIRGSAVNQDGRTNGLTAPNGLAQQDVIRQALKNGDVQPSEVGYVEAHGTGTPLGDPIEVNALGAAFGDRKTPLLIGTVKTNIGHLEPGAGIAGLIKTVLALQHGEIPKSLHFETPNPHIPWNELPVRVATERMPWPGQGRRIAGVSSFGFSGTNAHMVLESPPVKSHRVQPTDAAPAMERPLHLLTLSAKSEEALRQLAQRYVAIAKTSVPLADLCYSANGGRAHFRHRLAVVAKDCADLEAKLSAFCTKQEAPELFHGRIPRGNRPKTAFLFTGQGSQVAGMGAELYQTQPAFRRQLDQSAEILRPWLDRPLLPLLFDKPGSDAVSLLDQTAYTQPALFALEHALSALWQSWGIQPDVVMGHSIGELVAACVAGVLTLEDGLKLSAARGRLMQTRCVPGSMVSVMADEGQVAALIAPYRQDVALAAVNGPKNLVLSGGQESIWRLVETLTAHGLKTRMLTVSHAFHSPLMDPMLEEFRKVASAVSYSAPRLMLISNLTGLPATAAIATPAYWVRHAREPVRFAEGMAALYQQGVTQLVEMGPKPTLLGLGRTCYQQCASQASDREPIAGTWLPSLRPGHGETQQMLSSLSELYIQNSPVDWLGFEREFNRHKIDLPTYPFQRQEHWIAIKEPPSMPNHIIKADASHQSQLVAYLTEAVAGLLNLSPAAVETDVTFVEMGADSLLLSSLAESIQRRYSIEVGVHQLFDELGSIDLLAAFLSTQVAAEGAAAAKVSTGSTTVAVHTAPVPSPTVDHHLPPSSASALERVMSEQLLLVQNIISNQLAVLRGDASVQVATVPTQYGAGPSARSVAAVPPGQDAKPVAPTKLIARKLTAEQQQYLDAFMRRYAERTRTSKQHAQAARPVLDDGRSRRVLRPETWDINYPIVAERGNGGCFVDIDGNSYVDTCMGYGSLLFGHSASFIQEAIKAQLQQSFDVGPDLRMGLEVAELICKLTGMERVKFTTSGTGAVRTALRLARAATGRSRFVMFTGSYHGQSDGMLAVAGPSSEPLASQPMAPGVSPRAVGDALVLPNNDRKSLDTIRAHAHELAGILVEPVQSRNPGLQPREFLLQLRQLASELNVPLIFDEVITGFRIHPGGAQAVFGISADIASYGKVIGGGMPLGVVAGKHAYMDHLDSALWRYDSAPETAIEPTFAASTFEKHPLAMAATRAVLQRILEEGEALQEALNERTRRFVETVNAFFAQEQVPIEMAHFGSLFRFTWKNNISYLYQPLEMDLFYYHLISKGMYVWEGRTCYLSVAHTDEDIAKMVAAIQDSIADMQVGGFLSKSGGKQTTAQRPASTTDADRTMPLGEEQHALWTLSQRAGAQSPDWQIIVNFRLQGPLNGKALERAVQTLVERHEALRTIVDLHQPLQIVHARLPFTIERSDLSGEHGRAMDDVVAEWLAQAAATPLPLDRPLLRVHLVKLGESSHLVSLAAHHIITDGWSTGILLEELTALYSAECVGLSVQLKPARPYREFLDWQSQERHSATMAAHEAYWLEQFKSGIERATLPTSRRHRPETQYCGTRFASRLSPELFSQTKALSRAQGTTLFMTLLSAFGLLLHRLTGQSELVIGTPTAGRSMEQRDALVGYCTHLLPIRSQLPDGAAVSEYLSAMKQTVLAAFAHQAYPYSRLIQALSQKGHATPFPGVTTIFNMDRAAILPTLPGLQVEILPSPTSFSLVDFRLDCIEVGDTLCLDYEYSTDLFDQETIATWHATYVALLQSMVSAPTQRVSLLNALG